jgi:exosortase
MRGRRLFRAFARSGWSPWHLVGALILVALAVFVTSDAWRDMFRIAVKDEESSHAFLVPIVVAWLVWVRRKRLRHCRPTMLWVGPAMAALGGIMYSLGDTHLLQSVWHCGALLVAVGCLLTVLGAGVLRALLPAFVVLLFIIPVPGRVRQRIAIPLQTATAHVTQAVFELGESSVKRSGNLLNINGVDVAVGEACNGLRMMFALVLVSYTFAFGSPLKNYVRVIVLLASPASAVLCNVIRLIPTVWAFGNYSPSTAAVVHDVGGWVMLGISFALLMGLLRLLRWALVPVTPFTLAYE